MQFDQNVPDGAKIFDAQQLVFCTFNVHDQNIGRVFLHHHWKRLALRFHLSPR
ncbi:hypothetical protein D3C72_1938930 [compost metagenome]